MNNYLIRRCKECHKLMWFWQEHGKNYHGICFISLKIDSLEDDEI